MQHERIIERLAGMVATGRITAGKRPARTVGTAEFEALLATIRGVTRRPIRTPRSPPAP